MSEKIMLGFFIFLIGVGLFGLGMYYYDEYRKKRNNSNTYIIIVVVSYIVIFSSMMLIGNETLNFNKE